MEISNIRITVDASLGSLVLEPFICAEIEDILADTPAGGRVDLYVEKTRNDIAAKIWFRHPNKELNLSVVGRAGTPVVAVQEALNRLENSVYDWTHEASSPNYSRLRVCILQEKLGMQGELAPLLDECLCT